MTLTRLKATLILMDFKLKGINELTYIKEHVTVSLYPEGVNLYSLGLENFECLLPYHYALAAINNLLSKIPNK